MRISLSRKLCVGISDQVKHNPACSATDTRGVLKAELACHPARCLLPVEIIERCGLATGPSTVELLSN